MLNCSAIISESNLPLTIIFEMFNDGWILYLSCSFLIFVTGQRRFIASILARIPFGNLIISFF